jgi:hypothetical protein
MMKKLLALVLVLGMASLVSAVPSGVELSYHIGETVYTNGPDNVTEIEMQICTELLIDVHGPAGYAWIGYIIIEGDPPGGGEWGDAGGVAPGYYTNAAYWVVLPGAGDMGSVNGRYVEADWGWGYEISAAQGIGGVPGGEEFQFIYHCVGPESEYVTITLWDATNDPTYTTPEDTIVIHQIPEPATIALLGLGGLLLRRKK